VSKADGPVVEAAQDLEPHRIDAPMLRVEDALGEEAAGAEPVHDGFGEQRRRRVPVRDEQDGEGRLALAAVGSHAARLAAHR
jgi:hypothetical protein